MCAYNNESYPGSGMMHMKGVAWGILIICLSLLGIIIAFIMFGHIGPSFSSEILDKQQAQLREQFDLPPEEIITNQTELTIPPSLRNLNQNTANTN